MTVGGSSFSECPLRTFVICDTNSSFVCSNWLLLSKDGRCCYSCIGELKEAVIPDSVEELCEERFSGCASLSRVTFGESSSLKLVGMGAFCETGLREIRIPDSAEELCEECFQGGGNLFRVTFGESSSLKLISEGAFVWCGFLEIFRPGHLEEQGFFKPLSLTMPGAPSHDHIEN